MLNSFTEFKFFQSYRIAIEESDNIRFSVEVEEEDHQILYLDDAKLLDISIKGINVRSKQRLSIGLNVRVSINLKKLNLDLSGRVIRAFSTSIKDENIIYGIEIDEEEELKKLIEVYICTFSNEKLRDILLDTALTEKFNNPFEGLEILSLLLSLFKDITKYGEKEDFIETILEEVTRILNASRSCIFLVDPELGELSAIASSGMDKKDLKFDYRKGIAGSVFTSGISLNIDIEKDPSRFNNNIDLKTGFKTNSVICHPIHNRDDKIIGVIEIANKRNQDRFSVDDEKIMKVVTLVFSNLFHNFNPISEEGMIRRFSIPSDRKDALIGKSKAMIALRNSILKLKDLDAHVLIVGEKGVGKNLYASIIHREGKRGVEAVKSILGERNDNNFIDHITTAISECKNGTIILQDVDKLSISDCLYLLDVLRNNINNIRFIVTTSTNLERRVEEGLFERDLFNILSLATVMIDPLRKRKEDLKDLILYFLRLECKEQGFLLKSFSPSAMEKLIDYNWPGNIKELKQSIKRAVIYNPKTHVISNINNQATPIIMPEKSSFGDMGDIPFVNDSQIVLKDRLALIEREMILTEIKKHGGNKSKAAKVMGISREALRKKLMISQDIIDALLNYKNNLEYKVA